MTNLLGNLSTNILIIVLISINFQATSAAKCNEEQRDFVYGENEFIDQLMLCSLSKSYDLDLTPQGDYIKSTSRALVDQGLSNKTTILYAKLNGLWSGKRVKIIDSGWKCDKEKIILNSIIEFSGLSLEVIERVEIPLHRNQHKLALHKPCKTFDLPIWLCRSTKPIYRTTKTWINTAYFNLTLKQELGSGNVLKRPIIDRLSLIFTCPETFKQKVTHSPSAAYILSKFLINEPNLVIGHKVNRRRRRRRSLSDADALIGQSKLNDPDVGIQNGKGPAMPPYHNSVNLIISQTIATIRSNLNSCLEALDLDLSLIYNSYDSFRVASKYNPRHSKAINETANSALNLKCSHQSYIAQRINLAQEVDACQTGNGSSTSASASDSGSVNSSHSKRMTGESVSMLQYPNDPNQLLNPYGYYHDNSDKMIDDN